MFRKHGKFAVGLVIAAALSLPFAASAVTSGPATADDIQTQIRQLLEKIAGLQTQLQSLQGPKTTDQQIASTDSRLTTSSSRSERRICRVLLYRSIVQGLQGDDVLSLQEFLASEGYFNGTATGYFGPLSASALARWQAAQGLDAAGIAGPRTRELILKWCGGGTASTGDLKADPQRGTAPLTVNFKANVSTMNSSMVADAGEYKIEFGDGTEQKFTCTSSTGTCTGPQLASHTYSANGTYTAKLIHYGYFAAPNTPNTQTVGTATISVGQTTTACTLEYAPACGAKPITCITTPCNPIPTTYGNRCAMTADNATFLYSGACRTTSTNPADDPQCKRWTDGTYCGEKCFRNAPGGTYSCAIPACAVPEGGVYPASTPPKCLEYFGQTTTNSAPTISSFSGPSMLSINQSGTWTIAASDPQNDQLTYSVTWGDEGALTSIGNFAGWDTSVWTQQTTFTHSYNRQGVFTVQITVKDPSGKEAKATATVAVGIVPPTGGQVCTADAMMCPDGSYVGRTGASCTFVCPTTTVTGCVSGGTTYPEGTTRTSITNASGSISSIADAYYVCRSGQWKVEGGLTVCTAQAKQCPDGSYVGATGPNCSFVCPAGPTTTGSNGTASCKTYTGTAKAHGTVMTSCEAKGGFPTTSGTGQACTQESLSTYVVCQNGSWN